MTIAGEQLKQFPSATATQDADLIYTSQGGAEAAMTAVQLAAYANAKVNPANLPSRNTLTGSEKLAILQAGALVEATVNDLTTTNATRETFVAGTNFTAGTTTSITLAGTYGSINNILVFCDGSPQFDCTLTGQVLAFNPTVPAGTKKIFVNGGGARTIGTPSAGTVVDAIVAPGANINASKILYVPTAPNSMSRAINGKMNDTWSLYDFGAKIYGTADDTLAWQNAMASGELDIYFPFGTSNISGTIAPALNYLRIRGVGVGSRLLMQTANLPSLSIPTGLTGLAFKDFVLDRTPAATAGGDGLHWLSTTSQSLIENVQSKNHWNGFALGPTDFSRIVRCYSGNNFADGLYVSNGSGGGPCQWQIESILSSANNAHGLFIDGTSNVGGGMSLGEITNFSTFANTGCGIIAAGSAGNPVQGLRITGGFLGGDGNSELYLDTYGGQHKIVGVECELTGTGLTGRTGTTAASNIGSGIAITPNNSRIQVASPNINGTSGAGIAMNGTVLSIANPHITNCGIAAVAGSQNGVTALSGRTMIVGGFVADTGAGVQQYGISAGSGAVVRVTGTDMTGNTVGSTTGAGTVVQSNCLP